MIMNNKLHIVGICGSLRINSYNKMLLKTAGNSLPENVEFSIADISNLPLLSEDNENPLPDSVLELKKIVESADALFICTPEYNASVPGVLKNAIDWLTRPSTQSSLKPAFPGTPNEDSTLTASKAA